MRVAAILGAGGGIGAACARAAAEAGWRVVAGDIGGAAERAVGGLAHDPLALEADVTDEAAMGRLAATAAEAGEVGLLIYAAGVVGTMAVDRMDWTLHRRIMAVNLEGAFLAAAAFAPVLRPGGAAVFLSSVAGRRGEARASSYCASKFGLIGLAESLAAEWAPRGVRVCAVAPGNVDTPMLARVARDIAAAEGVTEEAVRERLRRAGAARRLVRPEEVAAVCVALGSPDFGAVTGATITVDAGAMVG
ncbi:SDR family NAD(P)-dependent oxidoreductase [Rubellimicrobium sp. CFH 75288]|uniref:SDR family NAD(P)-dependent oxidoreductase n=1 Tax=Rubellimicrobium sp. CFH 75288 TaxID=2697034 RepID=UPI0014129061|nr:SDR family oxidoreductase [Rubellimicrobium sp. CFH 75288]NAZ37356.1 SDR family oxidoreductase [Rubellimicrobium sp. CFH 75288]